MASGKRQPDSRGPSALAWSLLKGFPCSSGPRPSYRSHVALLFLLVVGGDACSSGPPVGSNDGGKGGAGGGGGSSDAGGQSGTTGEGGTTGQGGTAGSTGIGGSGGSGTGGATTRTCPAVIQFQAPCNVAPDVICTVPQTVCLPAGCQGNFQSFCQCNGVWSCPSYECFGPCDGGGGTGGGGTGGGGTGGTGPGGAGGRGGAGGTRPVP